MASSQRVAVAEVQRIAILMWMMIIDERSQSPSNLKSKLNVIKPFLLLTTY